MPHPPAPPISDKLIEWLEEVFPDRLPQTVRSDDWTKISRRIGQQDVIRKLRSEVAQSRERSLRSVQNV